MKNLNNTLRFFTIFVLTAVAAAAGSAAESPSNWQAAESFFDGRKQTMHGLTLSVYLDPRSGWPRIEKQVLIDQGRHYDSGQASGPHVSRVFSPVDLGAVVPVGGVRPRMEECCRTWAGTRLRLEYETEEKLDAELLSAEGGPFLEILVSRLVPAIRVKCNTDLALFGGVKATGSHEAALADGTLPYRKSIGSVAPEHWAVCLDGKVKTARFADLDLLPVEGLERGWLLCWYGGKSFFSGSTAADIRQFSAWTGDWDKKYSYQADCPMLVLPNSAVSAMEPGAEGDVVVSFADWGASVIILPLFGEYLPPAAETEKWAAAMPEQIIRRCEWWAGHMRKFPVSASETAAYDEGSGDVRLDVSFKWEEFRPAGETAAPLAPLLAAAVTEGFAVECKPGFYDPELFTSVGPWLCVPAAEAYTLRFPRLGRFAFSGGAAFAATPPERLRAKLAEEVGKIIAAGSLAPWLSLKKIQWSYVMVAGSAHLVHANNAEILTALADALPFLDEPLRTQALEYMRREREAYPPESAELRQGGDGARREAYLMGACFLAPDTGQPMQPTINNARRFNFYVRNKLVPQQNLYHLARYYEAAGTGGLPEKWDVIKSIRRPYLERADWASGGSYRWNDAYFLTTYGSPHIRCTDPIYGLGGVVDMNNRFAASVGHVRLARMAGDAVSEAEGWALFARDAAARVACAKMPASLYRRGLLKPEPHFSSPLDDIREIVALDEGGMSLGIYASDYSTGVSILWDAVPELALLLKEFAAEDTARYFRAFELIVPNWWLAWVEKTILQECNSPYPQESYQTFLAHALILDSPAQWLEKHLDVPWQARGDLYYLWKLIETMKAYQRAQNANQTVAR